MFYRDFIMGSYAELKKANPDFPILVREASGTEAKLIARYGECSRTAAASTCIC
jgi:hypothetical protein